jgi:hypothetical protein
VRDNEHATYDSQQGSNCETVKYENAHRLKRGKDKHLEGEQYGQQRE